MRVEVQCMTFGLATKERKVVWSIGNPHALKKVKYPPMDVAVDDRFLGFESGVHYPTTYLTLSTSTLLLNRHFPIHGLRVRVFIPRSRIAICHWLWLSFRHGVNKRAWAQHLMVEGTR